VDEMADFQIMESESLKLLRKHLKNQKERKKLEPRKWWSNEIRE